MDQIWDERVSHNAYLTILNYILYSRSTVDSELYRILEADEYLKKEKHIDLKDLRDYDTNSKKW